MPIPNNEVVFRRIPPGDQWFRMPDGVSSANFKLKKIESGKHEEGLSVYLKSKTSGEEVLQRPESIPGSFVLCATVGRIRDLTDGEDRPLELDVVEKAHEDDIGHAEIRRSGKWTRGVANSLKKLFLESFDDRIQIHGK